jgi:hypothetical protein
MKYCLRSAEHVQDPTEFDRLLQRARSKIETAKAINGSH